MPLKALHKLQNGSYFFYLSPPTPHPRPRSEAISVPREVAAKDSAELVRAFQLSAVPFWLVRWFLSHHTRGVHWSMCGRRCVSIVVCQACLDFFIFFFLPKPNANPFFCSRRGWGAGRKGGGGELVMLMCQHSNKKNKKKRAPVKTRTLLQPSMKTQK